jgi:hypothetical protein
MVDCGKSTARWRLVRAGVRGLWFRHLYNERTEIFRTAFAEREEEKFTTEAAEDTKSRKTNGSRTEDTARRSRNQMKHCVDVSAFGRKQHFESEN